MAIRKLAYAPEGSVPQPSAEIIKDFIMSSGTLRLEASLDKEVGVSFSNLPLTVFHRPFSFILHIGFVLYTFVIIFSKTEFGTSENANYLSLAYDNN